MLNKEPLFAQEKIDWKLLLMRILNCFGDMENDWHEEYWRRFGVTKEEGRAIVREYEKYEQEKVK
jgi:hypothetical protein